MSAKDDVFVEVLEGARARSRRGRSTSRAWSGGIERRWSARRVVVPCLDGSGWELEVLPVRDLDRVADDVEVLEARAVEPNVTFSRALLEAEYPRLARERVRGGIRLACLWRVDFVSESRRLVAFAPIATPRIGWPSHKVLRIASNEHLPLGTPLIDREEPEAVERFVAMLGDPDLDLPDVAIFADLPLASDFARSVARSVPARGIARRHSRAVLSQGDELALTSKRRRDLRRQRRNLECLGPVTHRIVDAGADLADALETFVALELKSWKGRRGTSLYSSRQVGAFARDAVARLARDGRANVHLLSVTDRPIAALLVIGSHSARITWKVAHDPDYAVHSPGVQILQEASLHYLEDGTTHVDSIAEEGHPVMELLWGSRMEIGDVIVPLRDHARDRAESIADAIERRGRWRSQAKRLVRRIGGRGSRLRRLLRV